jgi:hypothetical protein
MRIVAWVLAALALALLAGGCGGGTKLLPRGGGGGGGGSTAPPVAGRYLAQLSAEQARLARAEAALPPRPRTPAALSRSIRLLARAIHRLATGLAAIHAPPGLERLHRRLVAVAARYHAQLVRLAPQARRPEREVAAANALAAATSRASDAFTTSFARIHARLGH